MRYAPGTTAELTSTFTLIDGDPVNPDSVEVDIYNPDGLVVNDGIPVNVSIGLYRYDFDVPEDADLGLWRIEWHSVINGVHAYGDELFEVNFEGATPPAVLAEQLRGRLDEAKIDPEGDGSETFFNDEQIADLLFYGDGLDGATLEGWLRKQARYARLVDVSESGSIREMSQKFKHATVMVRFWSDVLGDASEAASLALAGRVVGRAVNLWGTEDPLALQTPFSGYSDHIREYPTHRLIIPAILG